MKGILVGDMELAIKKNQYCVDELTATLSSIYTDCSSLLNLFDNTNFSAFKSKVNINLNEFTHVKQRLDSFGLVLRNVYDGYIMQANEIAQQASKKF